MLEFAYDGSLNGDWVAHYAVRFAANTPARALRLVHVRDAALAPHVPARLARIEDECEVVGVRLETSLVSRDGADVASRLLEFVPPGATLIAGTRASPRRGALLAGTVSERLLDEGRFGVIAIRVAHPGVLGQPGDVLLPVTARPRAVVDALPVLGLLGADLRRLHVLLVQEMSRVGFRVLGAGAAERLLREGRAVVAGVEAELRSALATGTFELDSTVTVSDDAAKEICLQSARHRSRLICLGSPPRGRTLVPASASLVERVLASAPADVAIYRSSR